MTPQARERYGNLIAKVGLRDTAVITALMLLTHGEPMDKATLRLAGRAYALGLAVGTHQPDYAKALLALEDRTPPGEDEWVARTVATDLAPLA